MPLRINGFSGMDIDSMVKSLMTAKRVPLDKLNQQKTLLDWTRDSYREINSKLVDFRSNKLISKYGVSAAMNAQQAVVSGNTAALKAEASANATGIDMKVSITQLATKATLETKGAGTGLTTGSTLAEANATANGTPISAITDADKAQEYKLKVNGQSFTFKGSTGISTIISTINSNADAKVMASFDEITGKLILASKTSGSTGQVLLGAGVGDNTLLDAFKGIQQYTPPIGPATDVKPGVDAIVFINGTKMVKDSNIFTVNGVQMTLQATTVTVADPTVDPGAADTNKASITLTTDPQKAIDTIKGFIEDYNSLISVLNTKISEEKYRDFAPLTDEQKAEMKDDDITNWTAKAKSGLLKNDDILRSALSSMREVITTHIGDLSSVGITTGAYYEGGKLHLDENKLKQAVTDNPQRVLELFQGTVSAPNDGVFDKLASKINSTLDSLVSRVGTNKFSSDLTSSYKEESIMGKQLKEYNTRISTMQTNLNNAETRYYKQFTAMETAMSKLNSQSSNLLSSLGQS
ncbi:flagellar hook-associated protein 2 [Paenibacillus sophorae]|uniref:Flagellar hook-associated protein 2 n=1 Tax=Paenibacillus sophorae TaxID=1333845 RepID=A0A1H8I7P7_9BACL|nr:flagellar filament capping protein FliD [Paenibacillus sophorae]QWU15865.1 flagellar filament capping protein FliD [Paenibacillus sophorae]SEN64046.1 flagellar hook-associated protein 2 [Paenibacillus sophorae]